MITLHESNITSFPLDNGIGVLSDAIIAHAEEEINGLFEFYMEYDSDGVLVDELQKERIIKAKAQDKLGYQLFRIYRIRKHHENDNLVILARHITYDLADNFVESMIATSMTKKQVMEKIGSSTVEPHPFNITSTNNTTRSSTKLYRTNPLQMIAGMDGSVLQIWGGQLERDNFHLILHDRRGHDDRVTVSYEKNITGLTAEFDIGNLVTRIFPFVYIEATDGSPERLITVNGKYIDSPLINNYSKIYIEPIDYSLDDRIDIQDKTDAQIRQQLTNIASQYFVETGNDKVKASMDVAFAHLWETEEYKGVAPLELVGMGDGVTINHSKLKVDATAIVNYIRYDCIAHVNEEVRLGNVKAGLTDSLNKIDSIEKKVEQVESNATRAIVSANGKTTIYDGPDEPVNPQKGDVWFKIVDSDWEATYIFDGIEWQLRVHKDSAEAKQEAQQAKDDAQQAVDTANQAVGDAQNAINQAQTAFDDAQQALDGLTTLYEFKDDTTGDLTLIKGDIQGLQTSVSGKVDESTYNTFVQQTNQSLATKITMEDAEGSFVKETTFTATIDGLQTQVSDNAGNISNVTQLANAHQTQIGNLQGDVSTLTQTADSLVSNVSNLQDELDNLEIGGRNLFTSEGWSFHNPYASEIESDGTKYLKFEEKEHSNNIIAIKNDGYVSESGVFTFSGYVKIDGQIPSESYFREISNRSGSGTPEVRFDSETGYFAITQLVPDYSWTIHGRSTTPTVDGRIIELFDIKFEKGTVATDWTPAPEDMATQSQITQLSNNINLRVEKGDVLSQLNIEAGRTLIDTDKLVLSANTTHVTGDFKLDGSAHIQDASIGTAQIGTIDAAIASIININADHINTGSLQGVTVWIDGDKPDFLYSNAIDTNPNTQGTHIYIRPTADGYVRTTATNTTDYFVPIQTRGLLAPYAHSGNLYLAPFSTDDEVQLVGYNYITRNSTDKTYRDLRGRRFYANELEVNTGNILYLRSSDRVRIMNEGESESYSDLQLKDIRARSIRHNSELGGTHLYLGTNGEVRIVSNGTIANENWGSDIIYRPVRAEEFHAESGDFFGRDGGSLRITENTVQSMNIYERTYSSTSQMVRVTQNGVLGRSTSSRRYKLLEEPINTDYAKRLLNIDVKSWYDKTAVENYAKTLETGEETDPEPITRIGGVIAEDVHDAGLEMFVSYDKEGRPDGISHNLPLLLLPILKDHIKATDDRLSYLELENQYLRQKIEQLEAS